VSRVIVQCRGDIWWAVRNRSAYADWLQGHARLLLSFTLQHVMWFWICRLCLS